MKTGTYVKALVILAVLIVGMSGLYAAARSKPEDQQMAKADFAAIMTTESERLRAKLTQQFRAQGQVGLDHLMLMDPAANELHPSVKTAIEDKVRQGGNRHAVVKAMRQKWIDLVEQVARQRDGHHAGLYWYTDFSKAQAAAKASGKPILSLRLLGQLDTDLSCANSRYFRTALYPNKEVSQLLRDSFVLHWSSVRPVPVITIDMGDGRKIVRTITGNSIHYVLDSNGTPIDALPGLYGPKAFTRGLKQAQSAFQAYVVAATPMDRSVALKTYHADRLEKIAANWSQDLTAVGKQMSPQNEPKLSVRMITPNGHPDARLAAPLAVGKGRVETPILNRMPAGIQVIRSANEQPTALAAGKVTSGKFVLELPMLGHLAKANIVAPNLDVQKEATDDATWQLIAARHISDARLDAASRQLMFEKEGAFPGAALAAPMAISKNVVETPFLRMVRNFQNSIALDTVRNEYLFHSEIHRWFVDGNAITADVNQLNRRVYAELFLTPDEDPWLGLVPADTYAGLDNAGLRVEAVHASGK